ncbi:MAG: UPF0280 family protein [Desulfomonile tiedjei]|uniref:UPF0280 family protein n=1 Tax=Desulfomonile tiedjei TaxID=2358 RepID=A0A9D6UY42_9BACT|nr:UPF0280 family protein [Desulfomonile tiedjei]
MEPPVIYEPRTYRSFDKHERFKAFRVVIETSDLYVKAHSRLEKETEELIRKGRAQVEWAVAKRPEFLTSLVPVDEDPSDAPVVLRMIRAGKKAGTGPMAAVAGAIAEFVGRELCLLSPEVIVENGGDIFLNVQAPVVIGLYAGKSPFSGRVGLKVDATAIPMGICTSSAKVGPSLSLGSADAATIVSPDVALADAVATGLGNRIHRESDLKAAVEWALGVPGVVGALAILGDKIAAQGDLELVSIPE